MNIFFLILAHLKAYFYISYVHVSYGFCSSLKVCRLRHYGISIEHNFKGKSRCIALLCFLIYLIYFDARCQNMTKPSSFFMKNMFGNILEINTKSQILNSFEKVYQPNTLVSFLALCRIVIKNETVHPMKCNSHQNITSNEKCKYHYS